MTPNDKSEGPAAKAPGLRLQVVLAQAGLASRRGVVDLITSGQITVNGQVVVEKGFRVNPETDQIAVNGSPIGNISDIQKVYYIFHKPKGVTTTMSDPHAEKPISEFFKDVTERIFPVGRLDLDTTGLILLTNDGEISFRLTHPKFGIEKKYQALLSDYLSDEDKAEIEKGVSLEEGETAPCKVIIHERTPVQTNVTVILHEGKKRQIRRMFEMAGNRVLELHRFEYGPLGLGTLRPGQRCELTGKEIQSLKKAVGL